LSGLTCAGVIGRTTGLVADPAHGGLAAVLAAALSSVAILSVSISSSLRCSTPANEVLVRMSSSSFTWMAAPSRF
jgi:hypothetical protein